MSIVLKGQGWIPEIGLVCECLADSRKSKDDSPQYEMVQIVGYDGMYEQVQYIPLFGRFKGILCHSSQMADFTAICSFGGLRNEQRD